MTTVTNTALNELLRKTLWGHLNTHAMWKSDFYRVAEPDREEFRGTQNSGEQDPHRVWKMLCVWAENMMAASYGFQTYVLLLASRASDEAVRRSLLDNAWEELGDVQYPQRSHYNMVCELSKRLCFVPGPNITKPRLLPTTISHISTHIDRCKHAPFLQALGMVYLIEALTRIEFSRVLGAFIRWYPEGTGRRLEEFALKGGVAYFSANIEADLKHQEDVEHMIALTLQSADRSPTSSVGIDQALALIEAGIRESLFYRAGFVQGVFDSVFQPSRVGPAVETSLDHVSAATFDKVYQN